MQKISFLPFIDQISPEQSSDNNDVDLVENYTSISVNNNNLSCIIEKISELTEKYKKIDELKTNLLEMETRQRRIEKKLDSINERILIILNTLNNPNNLKHANYSDATMVKILNNSELQIEIAPTNCMGTKISDDFDIKESMASPILAENTSEMNLEMSKDCDTLNETEPVEPFVKLVEYTDLFELFHFGEFDICDLVMHEKFNKGCSLSAILDEMVRKKQIHKGLDNRYSCNLRYYNGKYLDRNRIVRKMRRLDDGKLITIGEFRRLFNFKGRPPLKEISELFEECVKENILLKEYRKKRIFYGLK